VAIVGSQFFGAHALNYALYFLHHSEMLLRLFFFVSKCFKSPLKKSLKINKKTLTRNKMQRKINIF
jgi:hypothetical protein